jgi:hypothetical protein
MSRHSHKSIDTQEVANFLESTTTGQGQNERKNDNPGTVSAVGQLKEESSHPQTSQGNLPIVPRGEANFDAGMV